MGEWFKDWFNSPYYPVLYDYRNEEEASSFISNLCSQLHPVEGKKITDIGCGSGRHCRELFRHNLQVSGIDISPNSIQQARAAGPQEIQYYCHDMREPLPVENQDIITSLFTSFGYFNSDDESQTVLQNIKNALKPGGILVMDYLNSRFVVQAGNRKEETDKNGIKFHVEKWIDGTHVRKKIVVTDKGQTSTYCEQVRLYTLEDFTQLMNKSNLEIIFTFGSGNFTPFDPDTSPRLVILARRK